MSLTRDKKKFIRKILFFILFLFVLDRTSGALMKYLFFSQQSGKYYRMSYAINETKADIVIFGSSRAHTQYIPSIISKKLNLSCYNAGVKGEGILFASAIQDMMLERHKPNVIILNIDPALLDKFPKFYERISDLLPHYGNHPEEMKIYIELKGKYEFIKLLSKLYPYNSKILYIIKYFFKPQPDYNGYTPMYEKLRFNNYDSNVDMKDFYNNDESDLDSNYVDCFNNFVANSLNAKAKLIFVLSPFYLPVGVKDNIIKYCVSLRNMNSIAEKYHIPFIDFSNDPLFTLNNNLFDDISHLNDEGANLFSEKLADSLNNIFSKSKLIKLKN